MEHPENLEIPTPMGPIKASSLHLNTFLTVISLLLLVVMAYAIWMHQQDSKAAQADFVVALREQTAAIREGSKLQREQNCLMRFEDAERRRQSDFCKQLSQ